MDTKEFLKSICTEASISGHESKVTEIIKKEFSQYCDEVHVDRFGNLVALRKGSGKGKIMYAAHMDEIGLIVNYIDDKGLIKFSSIGGFDQRTLVGQEVYVHGKEKVFGVIGMKPPHLISPEDRDKALKSEDLRIDCGFNFEQISALVRVGDCITIKRDFIDLQNNMFSCKALDDRAGVASLLECMKNLEHVRHDYDVYYVATTQEEVGVRGALTATYNINPDIGVAIDVGFARTPELDEFDTIEFNKGPGLAIGPNVHPCVLEGFKNVCKQNKITYQIEVVPGMSGTDAYYIQINGEGVASAVVSIPLRYMHTSVETMCMDDITETGRLLSCFVTGLNGKDVEEFLCL